MRPVVAQGQKFVGVTVNAAGCGFKPHSNKIKYLFNFTLSFLRCVVETKENGERSVLTLGSLCVSCCVIQRESDLFIF